MPAPSKSSQRFFGMVRGVQKGTVPKAKVGVKARQAALRMSPGQVHDFAATPTKGLPERVKGRTGAAGYRQRMKGG